MLSGYQRKPINGVSLDIYAPLSTYHSNIYYAFLSTYPSNIY